MITIGLIAWVIYLLWQNSRLKSEIREILLENQIVIGEDAKRFMENHDRICRGEFTAEELQERERLRQDK